MKKKKIGKTTIETPIVGLGTGSLGLIDQNFAALQYSSASDWKNYMDRDLGITTVLAAIDAGIRFIDTAPWYGRGFAEETIGEALRQVSPEIRKEVVVATKIGHRYPGDDYDFSYDAAMRSFGESQKRLGIERFPLVHLHDPMGIPMEKVMGKQGVFAAMQALRDQKMIEFIGIGANNPETAADYIATGKFDAAIVVGAWSLINQSAKLRIIPAAQRTGLIAATAIERGILATGFREGILYQERRFNSELIAHVTTMRELCESFHIPLLAAALQWCVRDPHFALAIPGARTPEQARENAAMGNVLIPEVFWKKLTPFIKTWDCVV